MAQTTDHPVDGNHYLGLFLRSTEVLGESLDYRETLRNVCAAAVESIADICIIDLGPPGETEMVGAAHRDPARTRDTQSAGIHLESDPDRPMHPVCQVLLSGQTFYAPRIDEAWIDDHATRAEHRAFMVRMRYTSMIVAPLRSQIFGLTGTLSLVTTAGGREPFPPNALEFAEGLARLCAAAIGKARIFEEARAVASSFQQAALPRILPHPGALQFHAFYQPAREGVLVGGDWYDAFALPDGRIGVSVGDASGHGLTASVMMASVKNALRTSLIMEPDLGRALDTVDYLIRTEYSDGSFCTAALGIIDPGAMTLRLASAGHPGPMVWDPNVGAVTDPFTDRDLPLGLRDLAGGRARPKTISIAGGFVVFFTDGLVECGRDILTGEVALADTIARDDIRHAPDPAGAIREAIADCDKAEDDIAILVMRLG